MSDRRRSPSEYGSGEGISIGLELDRRPPREGMRLLLECVRNLMREDCSATGPVQRTLGLESYF